LYSGKALKSITDTGLGTIGRIDHTNVAVNVISSRRLRMHIDFEGHKAKISSNNIKLMKAGKIFHHEEHILEPLEGLQIFIRKKK
jgi:hypothetical protein